jgi:hypothetical protein
VRAAVAVLLVAIALAGAPYLISLRLGGSQYWPSGSTCRNHGAAYSAYGCGGLVPVPVEATHNRAAWQIAVSILIGALGLVGGLSVLRKQRKSNPRSPALPVGPEY